MIRNIRMNMRYPLLALLAVAASWTALTGEKAQAQSTLPTFSCTSDFYEIIEGDLHVLNISTGVYDPIGPDHPKYNGAGYNVNDDYIYLVDHDRASSTRFHLIRMGSNGQVEDLGNVGVSANAGDMDLDNKLYLKDGNSSLSVVNVLNSTTTTLNFSGSTGASLWDIAYIDTGVSKAMVGAREGSVRYYNLTTGVAGSIPVPGLPAGSNYGAVWSTSNGNLFISENGSGTITEISDPLGSPAIVGTFSAADASNHDGASCYLASSPLSPAPDRSDAPNSGTAPNGSGTNAYDGAEHTIVSGIRLGAAIDEDGGPIANPDATGDGGDDDGISAFPTLTEGDTSYTIAPTDFNAGAGDGTLYAWIDFDGDGAFETTEFASATVTGGAVQGALNFSGFGATMNAGTTFARFRLTNDTLTSANFATSASDGEVEDYTVTIAAAPTGPSLPPFTCSADFYEIIGGDLHILDIATGNYNPIGPDHQQLSASGYNVNDNYIYLIDDDASSATQFNLFRMGSNGQIEDLGNVGVASNAGDMDLDNNFYMKNSNSSLHVVDVLTNATTTLNFSGTTGGNVADFAYIESGTSKAMIGVHNGSVRYYNLTTGVAGSTVVPGLTTTGKYGAAWSTSNGNLFVSENGTGTITEISDPLGTPAIVNTFSAANTSDHDGASCYYASSPLPPAPDRSDAPIVGTAPDGVGTNAYGNAEHTVVAGIRLGAAIDEDGGPITNSDASGDAGDDDGISAFPTLTEGVTSYTITPTDFNAGAGGDTLYAWIDFDGDGVFEASEFASSPATNGVPTGNLNFSGFGTTMNAGTTFARFRLTTDTLSSADAATAASDGEVEDYAVTVAASSSLPPMGPLQVCPVQDGAEILFRSGNSWDDGAPPPYAVWTFNDTPGVQNNTGGTIASLGTFTAGPGLSAPQVGSARNVTNVSATTLAESFALDEYVQHPFTTGSTEGLIIDQIQFRDLTEPSTRFPSDFALMISDDPNFGHASVMLQDAYYGDNGSPVRTKYPLVNRVVMEANKQYYLRFYFYNMAASAGLFYDDLTFYTHQCTDYGDAPTIYGDAIHVPKAGMYLGAGLPDLDLISLQGGDAGASASGDGADEDGVSSFPTLTEGDTIYTLPAANISATGTGTLHAWIDFNGDDVFQSTEHTSTTVSGGTLTGDLDWTGQSTTATGTTYARLRFTDDLTVTNATAFSFADSGEAEDYAVTITTFDYSDAPLTGTTYGGASHRIVSGISLGGTVTNELSAYDSPNADGDVDNGVTIPTLTQGTSATITATVQGASGYLQAWIDWNGNGSFNDTVDGISEQIVIDLQDGDLLDINANAGTISFTVNVPASATIAQTFSRFRWSTESDLDSVSAASDGEVEDYAFTIQPGFDYSDAPASYGSASHALVTGPTRIGLINTNEATDYDDANASADAGDDGVTIPVLILGGADTISVDVAGSGFLQAWIDWDGSGTFDSPTEQIATDIQDFGTGTILIPVTVPNDAVIGQTFARFRWSTDFNIGANGLAPDGEVEDYAVTIEMGNTVLSGQVFLDNGIGSGVAHDALVNGTEQGGTFGSIAIFSTATNTQIATATIDAVGNWNAALPDGFTGEVRLEAMADPGYRIISENVDSLPAPTNPSTVDGTYTFTPATGTSYSGLNIGLIAEPTLTQNQSVTALPGQVVDLAHVYTATTSGTVSFALTDSVSVPAGAFSTTIFDDTDCDGVPDQVLDTSKVVNAGDQICVVLRTQAGLGNGSSATHSYALNATTQYSTTTASGTLINYDSINGGDGDDVLLEKLVTNITKSTPEGVSNSADIGDVLRYRIIVTNPSTGPATNIAIYDQTPAYTSLEAPIPTPVTVAAGVTCALTEPSGNVSGYSGPLQWDCAGAFPPGGSGSVTFEVRIAQ